MSINWVMKDPTAKRPFVPLPRERALLASPHRTALSLKSPKPSSPSQPVDASEVVDLSSPSGIAYLTSSRLVYLPSTPTATFQSFSVPLLNLHDTYVTAPWFGPNVVGGQVQPVREGGLPTPAAAPYMLELKLTFNEGGAYDFHAKFAEVRERLVQNREMVREIGENVSHQELHGEQLPAYEERETDTAVTTTTTTTAGSSGANRLSGGEASRSASARDYTAPPDEPPPGYEETQQSQ